MPTIQNEIYQLYFESNEILHIYLNNWIYLYYTGIIFESNEIYQLYFESNEILHIYLNNWIYMYYTGIIFESYEIYQLYFESNEILHIYLNNWIYTYYTAIIFESYEICIYTWKLTIMWNDFANRPKWNLSIIIGIKQVLAKP